MIEGPYQSKQDLIARRIVLTLFILLMLSIIVGTFNEAMDRAYSRGQEDMLSEVSDVVHQYKDLTCEPS